MTKPAPQRRQLNNDLRLLARTFGFVRRRLITVFALATMTAILEAAIVLSIAAAGTTLLDGSGSSNSLVSGIPMDLTLRQLCLGVGVLVVVRAGLDLLMIEIKARTEVLYDASARTEVTNAYLEADWNTQSTEQAGGLQAALVTFVSLARTVLTKLIDLSLSIVSFVVMLVASITVGGRVTVLVVIAMGALAYLLRPFIRANRHASARQRAAIGRFSNQVNEMVSMSREIRVLGITEPIKGELGVEIAELKAAGHASSAASYRLQSLHASLTYLVVSIGLGALIFSTVSDPQPYAAMVLLLYRAMVYGRAVQTTYQGVVGSIPFLEDLDERLDLYRQAQRQPGVDPLPTVGTITFDAVDFSYGDGTRALEDISVTIQPGDAIGIVGPSGAGKSTFVQLLLGLRAPTGGRLVVGEHSIADYREDDWSRLVSFVPQESQLFDMSVLDNVISFRPHVTRDAAIQALQAAHVLTEMEALPDGLDTTVGEGGSRISGGQRQRVCIARALAASPQLLVLDEPTSALDLASEEAIRATLEVLKGQVTLVIVAHRLSTLRVCDKVLVITQGRVDAFAERRELEANNEYFSSAVELAKLV